MNSLESSSIYFLIYLIVCAGSSAVLLSKSPSMAKASLDDGRNANSVKVERRTKNKGYRGEFGEVYRKKYNLDDSHNLIPTLDTSKESMDDDDDDDEDDDDCGYEGDHASSKKEEFKNKIDEFPTYYPPGYDTSKFLGDSEKIAKPLLGISDSFVYESSPSLELYPGVLKGFLDTILNYLNIVREDLRVSLHEFFSHLNDSIKFGGGTPLLEYGDAFF